MCDLVECCSHLMPDNEDQELALRLLEDAAMNARVCDDKWLYLAYIKVLEEYVYVDKHKELRKRMLTYWKEKENERDHNTTPH